VPELEFVQDGQQGWPRRWRETIVPIFQRGTVSIQGARLCLKDQPQHMRIHCHVLLMMTCCGWRFAHNRAPVDLRRLEKLCWRETGAFIVTVNCANLES
jgi:hypothetical protein